MNDNELYGLGAAVIGTAPVPVDERSAKEIIKRQTRVITELRKAVRGKLRITTTPYGIIDIYIDAFYSEDEAVAFDKAVHALWR